TEEDNGRLEPLLATAVSRPKWLLSHGLCALAGVIILSIVAGLSAGLAYWLTADVAFAEVPRIAMAALVQIPAILTLGALAVALFGLLPRWVSVLSWSAFVLCLVLNYFGALLKLPDWILKLTPFAHTPPAPAASVSMAPL